MNRFAKFDEAHKELFFSVLDELSADFNGMSANDKEYLAMKIENNQFLNENNQKALRNSTLMLRLLKMVYLWRPDDGDVEEQIKNKTEEFARLLKNAVNKQIEH